MIRLLALIAALSLASSAHAAEPFDPFHQAGIDDKPNARAPMATTFQDERGQQVSLAQLAGGKPLVLAFVQHRCPNLCGVSLDGLSQAASQQTGHGFAIAALSIDPRETPADAQASLSHLTAAGAPIHGLTGQQPAIAAVATALGYRYAWDPRLAQYAHVSASAVLSPKGQLAGWIYGLNPPPQVLKTALAAAAKGGFAGVGEKLLLLCYHYDANKGHYDPIAWTMVRLASGLAVLLLAAFIALSLLKERRAKDLRA